MEIQVLGYLVQFAGVLLIAVGLLEIRRRQQQD